MYLKTFGQPHIIILIQFLRCTRQLATTIFAPVNLITHDYTMHMYVNNGQACHPDKAD